MNWKVVPAVFGMCRKSIINALAGSKLAEFAAGGKA
jgi:hypothetical protein